MLSTTIVHVCLRCGSEKIRKNGHADNGAQRARCLECGRTFILQPKGARYDPRFKAQVVAAYQDRMAAAVAITGRRSISSRRHPRHIAHSMTAQIPDTFLSNGEEFDLIALKGEDLMDPVRDLGLTPTMMHTACYRGFYATYEVADDGLFLVGLTICAEDRHYPPLDGVTPEIGEGGHQAKYNGLRRQTPFTGKMRLARDFIQERYVHMGFQDATAYRVVFDFTFQNGRVVTRKDLSAEVVRVRERMKGADPGGLGQGDIVRWIDRRFTLDFDEEIGSEP